MAVARIANRALETTTTTGTGTLTLAGAVTGYQTIIDSGDISSGDSVRYVIVDSLTSPTIYEIGVGTITAGASDTLSRDTVEESSNSGSKVNLTGTNFVFSATSVDWLRQIASGLGMWGGTSGGSANAQTVSTDLNLPAYTAGEQVTFIAGFTNTSALTLNRDGLGARNIFTDGAALDGGEIVAGNAYKIVYDGTQYRVLAPANRFEFKATLADDTATNVLAPAQSGAAILVIGGATHVPQSVQFVYRAATSPVIGGQRINASGGSLVTFVTGTLSGTTGDDGRFTISANTDGRLYFENRFGVSRNIAVSFLAPVIA